MLYIALESPMQKILFIGLTISCSRIAENVHKEKYVHKYFKNCTYECSQRFFFIPTKKSGLSNRLEVSISKKKQ